MRIRVIDYHDEVENISKSSRIVLASDAPSVFATFDGTITQALPSAEFSDSVTERHHRPSLGATCLLRRFKHLMMVAGRSQGTTFRGTGCHFGLTAQRGDTEDAEEGEFENRALNGSLDR
jgi:hypothetical protein